MEKLNIEELHSLNSLADIIRMVKLRRRRRIWAEHVACMVSIRIAYRILVGRLKRKNRLGP
jgi:hypothetical protein